MSSPILVKQYPDKLEIGNPGGFIGGISSENILHHQPAARNLLLVDALTRMRLVNRSNLGVSRMFQAMLIEGKEPPLIRKITHLDRYQVVRLMRELISEDSLIELIGKGRKAAYVYVSQKAN